MATPNGVGPQPTNIDSVSCLSVDDCTAVGYSNGAAPLIDRWDGTKWSFNRVPDVVGTTQAILAGVSCVSAGACMAVGDAYGNPGTALAEVRDGVRWQVVATPELSDATLTAVRFATSTVPASDVTVDSST